MKNDNPEVSKYPIPEIFHSYATGTLFDKCIECERLLLDQNVPYFIEKAFRKYAGYKAEDVAVEYAICANCTIKMRVQMSRESLQQIETFMMENIRLDLKEALMEQHPESPEEWVNQCVFSGDLRNDVLEYQIYAQCFNDHLVLPAMPYMISGSVLDKIVNLLSNKTLGEMDDFMGRHFGPPPEFEVNPRRKVILL